MVKISTLYVFFDLATDFKDLARSMNGHAGSWGEVQQPNTRRQKISIYCIPYTIFDVLCMWNFYIALNIVRLLRTVVNQTVQQDFHKKGDGVLSLTSDSGVTVHISRGISFSSSFFIEQQIMHIKMT